uniref:Uncharacterized protein n=1 Tax=Nelumbo nucifera TaxID=4432 RepID=A0A822ZEP1_NELNU|nr:TPA_asm: hypothetical protein HUJ06_001263 [Nelumbo nucifera]
MGWVILFVVRGERRGEAEVGRRRSRAVKRMPRE